MDRDKILSTLSTISAQEQPQTSSLRQQAHSIISASPRDDVNNLPNVLLDLLSQIIKPLFTTTKHPHLTATGRKSLVPPPPPSIANRFLNDPFEDGDDDGSGSSRPWKTPFTTAMLNYILRSYMLLPFDIPDEVTRKTTIEGHFHLLVPAILNMIDDPSPTPWKSSGCRLLGLLCEVLVSTQSEILKRSGLADVFIDALKTNFLLLPTLTLEEESLEVLGILYPAFVGVVDARFVKLVSVREETWRGREKSDAGTTWAMGEEFVRYQEMLILIYRHGVMASMSHLSASSDSLSNTSSVPLTTFLLRQIPALFRRMGVDSVKHLQTLLPMLRVGLMDPFVLAAPEMAVAMLDILECVFDVGEVRVKEKWWTEILRGLIGCWLNLGDEREGNEQSLRENKKAEEVTARLKKTTGLLGAVVGREEWKQVTKKLVEEEGVLKVLFEE